MEIQTNYFTTAKTARYSAFGELSSSTKYFWFALHGSKMLCEQMLHKFKDFNPKEHFVVAPEALMRFYEKDFGGPVVASWMTKRDRLTEITDFSTYLSSLYDKITSNLPSNCVKTILAFSQGGTIAFRWLHHSKVETDFFIPYACWIPEDIPIKTGKTNFDALQTLFTYGTEDQFLTEKRISMVNDVIEKNQLSIQSLPYAGTHRIDREHLYNLFEYYIKK